MVCSYIYLFTKQKILGWFKFKAFTANNRNATENMDFRLVRTENIVGKGENAGYQKMLVTSIFSFSHNIFQRVILESLKVVTVQKGFFVLYKCLGFR